MGFTLGAAQRVQVWHFRLHFPEISNIQRVNL